MDGTIYRADVPALTECLHALNQQPGHIDTRQAQFISTLQTLISERQNRSRHEVAVQQSKELHQQASQQAKDHHQEAQLSAAKISGGIAEVKGEIAEAKGEIAKVKIEVVEIKGTLERTHQIHSWILFVAIVTAILAGVAAWDVIEKWFPNKPVAPVSEIIQTKPPHSTNK
jgi:chromosome segregation ATPase